VSDGGVYQVEAIKQGDSYTCDFRISDDRFTVHSLCRYKERDQEVEHKEIAEFRKADDQKWYYYDSKRPASTYRREEPKIGRNDPCPCGSGKKYKKCSIFSLLTSPTLFPEIR
jgi:uncharacterized protein YchJ